MVHHSKASALQDFCAQWAIGLHLVCVSDECVLVIFHMGFSVFKGSCESPQGVG